MPGKGSRGRYSRDYIDEHHDGFRYRRAVPSELLPIIGKSVWCAWLGNVGRKEAERRARPIAMAHDELIERMKGLTSDEKKRIAADGGQSPWAWRQLVDKHIALPLGEGLLLYIRPDDALPDSAQLADMKFAADARTRLEAMRANTHAAQRTARKLTGDSGLDGLVELRIKAVAPTQPVIDGWRRAVRRFKELVGDRGPDEITRADMFAFRDRLEAIGNGKNKRPDVDAMLGNMHALLETAVAEGLRDFNPATKIKPRPDPNRKFADDGEKSFTPEQMRTILSRVGELKKGDDRIVTRLMTYSGARSGELCQLRTCDVVKIDGIDAISITDEGENRSVKNKSSLRVVPLHPAIRDEIVTLAERIRQEKGPDAHLFYYRYYPRKNSWSRQFQEHFKRWLRIKLKITDGGLSVHNLRHTFIDACRAAEVPENVAEAITGHAPKTEHAKYGKGVALRVKAKWIRKVDPARQR